MTSHDSPVTKPHSLRGRGAAIQPPNRFERLHIELDPGMEPDNVRTTFLRDDSQSIISRNDSPDIPFSAGLNPYRGCEHGCSYCYARPYHEYLGFSSGLDFESRIVVKMNAPELLRAELARPGWKPQVIGMSGVTDCYQPVERKLEITRRCLAVLAEFRNPVGVITKNHLVTRDKDHLAELARHRAVRVFLSVTTLDSALASLLEPRASRPQHRFAAIRELADRGIPVGVSVAPIIPGINEHEIPAILAAAAKAGATSASYTILRLPWQVKDIFRTWLETHFPDRVDRVFGRLEEAGGAKRSDFGTRMKGSGSCAEEIEQLFRVCLRRSGLNQRRHELSTVAFRRIDPSQPEFDL